MSDDDDLRGALRSGADAVRGRRDDAALERRLARVDRIRTATRAGVAASIVAVVLGAVVLIGRSDEPTTVATSPEPAGPEQVTAAPGPDTSVTVPVTEVEPGSTLTVPEAPSSVSSLTTVPAPTPTSAPTTAPVPACSAAPSARSGASLTVGFSGTAPPGTLAKVEAKAGATGSAQSVVGASGQWQLQVTFVGATPNQPIEVWAGCPALGAKSVLTYAWTP